MSELEGYLRRVAFWLPRESREDVLSELREALEARLANVAARKGRALDDGDYAAVFSHFGHPTVVAARYVERRPVISSMLAFFYWRLLGMALTAIVVAQSALLAVELAGTGLNGPIVAEAFERIVVACLLGFACVTITFVVLDRRFGLPEGRFE